jgi:hypothetical protein
MPSCRNFLNSCLAQREERQGGGVGETSQRDTNMSKEGQNTRSAHSHTN